MIPEPDQYLSFLMGADSIQDAELTGLGVTILRGAGSRFRGLLVPSGSLAAYRRLVREKLAPGFWNDVVGRREVFFTFKLADGTSKELTLSEANRSEIARLCSSLNKDPIEKTSDLPRYLAGNPFYRDVIEAFHTSASGGPSQREAERLEAHRGSCHCGRITFETRAHLAYVVDCNCSLCRRRGALWHLVPDSDLRIVTGEGDLVLYQFHTRTAKHYFCRHCGVHPFIRPRIDPGRWAVNVRCLEGVDLSSLQVHPFDGANWEEAAKAYLERRK